MEIGEIKIIETITDPVTETDQEADGTMIGQVIGVTITRLTIGEVMLDQIMDKMLNEHSGTEVKVDRTGNYNNDYMRGRGRDRHNDRPVQSRSTSHDCIRCYRCREYDHFASECPNIPDCDYADPASLQVIIQDYYPIDSEGEKEYLNL